ncbi:M28 family metallopeptidase [Nonomuraea dietziae]|uniref:M28 family metallopeptidase n=1 Tax=Nonomuraea dietziae TaxID=65515 RepID=UPI0034170230
MTSSPLIQAPALEAVLERISVQRMSATVQELAHDRYTGRRVGTAGGRSAAAWLAEQLRALGGEVESESFTVTSVRELYGTPVLEWTADGRTRRLEHRREFVEHLASAELPHAHTAPVVAQTDTADVHGRWVLGDAADWARAEEGGAAGVLTARGTDAGGWMPKMIAGPGVRTVPVIALRPDLHRELGEAVTRTPVQVTASMPLRSVSVDGLNVYAHLNRSHGAPRVLLTAHHDGVGDDPQRRLPAAADNASGVAAILEAARVLSAQALAINVSVAFLDAEEAGALGSAHHVRAVPPDTLVINLDGAAKLHEAASVEAGGPAHGLLAALDQAGRETGVPLRAGAMASDNRRYAAAGLAAIGIGMGMPGYQTPAETPDRVEAGTLLAAAQLVTATVWRLAHTGS